MYRIQKKDSLITVTSVANSVCTAYQSLKRDVRDESAKRTESLPRILVKETHGDVESGTTPALESVSVLESVGSLLGDVGHVDRTQAGCEEGL